MPQPAISIRNLGKRYRLSHSGQRASYRTLRESLSRAATAPLRRLRGGRSDTTSEEFWALENVSFDVRPTEVLGVIGRNGAGKSTLLKILSRITKPTAGEVLLRGRVGSLLEVGTGFHPELTGRENIFLNGAILGMSRREILDKFDAIVDFAGTERFLDTPVKHYSSGMSMRLAFAVAAQLEPELLLIDEVLAVGDGDFQKKCLGRMGALATAGRTLVFVSHNLTAIRTLCQTAVWLERGRVRMHGHVNDVVNGYIESAEGLASRRVWDAVETAPGNELLRLHRVCVAPGGSSPAKSISVDTAVDIDFELWNLTSEATLNLSLVLYSLEGTCIFNSIAPAATVGRGLFRGRCHVPQNLLNDGVYSVRLLVAKDQATVIFDMSDLATFEVHDVERPILWFGKLIGAVRPRLDWEIESLGAGAPRRSRPLAAEIVMRMLARRLLRPPWRAWKAARYAGRLALARRALRRFAPPYRINAGCGPVPFAGWVNIDDNHELDTVDLFWDLSQGLPTPDATCEAIFAEHLLEHLNLQQGLNFLRDCLRSLVPGGVLRIAMPSLDDMIEKSASGHWNDQSWLREPQWQFIASRAEMFNIMFRWWGHQWIYDREELHRRLREAGFEVIRDVAWGESVVECLRNRETRPSSLLICEAVKTSPP